MFKVGDVVICVYEGSGIYIKRGKEYTISSIESDEEHPKKSLISVKEFEGKKFFTYRFVLKEQPVPAPVV